MRDRALEFKVGLLIASAAVILVGFVLILGNFAIGDGYTLRVDYNFSGNIQEGAPVKVSGIKVGKVEEVMFLGGKKDPGTGRRVMVRLRVWLERRVQDTLRQDAEFFVNTAGVLGEQYLEIVPGDDYDNPPLEPGTVVRGVDPPRTDLIVARLYEVLDEVSRILREDGELITNLLRDSAGAVREANALLRDNRKQIGELIVSADDLAGRSAAVLGKVNRGLGDGRVVGKTLRDADRLLVSANRSLEALTAPLEELLRDARRATGLVDEQRLDRALEVADQAVAVAGKAGALIDRVDAVVARIAKGEGTAGALIVREEIYADLRELIRDLGRNPWKLFWKE